MLLGAGVLALQLLLTNYVDRIERGRRPRRPPGRRRRPGHVNAFAMVFRTRYLLLIGLMLMLLNWINTTGEYILGSIVKETASAIDRSRRGAGTERGTAHRRLLLEVLHAGERRRPASSAVRRCRAS